MNLVSLGPHANGKRSDEGVSDGSMILAVRRANVQVLT
jgi:hypothetical protein